MSSGTKQESPQFPQSFRQAVPRSTRTLYAFAAVSLGVIIAGFWNFHVVDGFGESAIAEPIIGEAGVAGSVALEGMTFGVMFAVAAGLAATFTACNCVVFAMLPELACKIDESGSQIDRQIVYRSLAAFVGGVIIVGMPYGAFVGFAGSSGIEAMNEVRIAQASAVFSFIGIGLLVWGLAEMGFLKRFGSQLTPTTRAFLAQPATRAGLMGVFVGLFAVGRPFPVFRDFLTYAAAADSPLYGIAVMSIHGIAMIAVMLAMLFAMVFIFGSRLTRWIQHNPHSPRLVSAFALLAGGAYFLFYWGLARMFEIGRWGYRLGIYG